MSSYLVAKLVPLPLCPRIQWVGNTSPDRFQNLARLPRLDAPLRCHSPRSDAHVGARKPGILTLAISVVILCAFVL